MKALDCGRLEKQSEKKVVFFSALSDFLGLEQDWNKLIADTEGPCFFQSFAWIHHVAKARLNSGADSWRLCIATIWRGDDLLGLWPLCLQKAGLCWIAQCLDQPFGQFAGLLRHPSLDADIAFTTILKALKDQKMASGLQIERVIEDTPLHRTLKASGASMIFSDKSVFLDFRPFGSFDGYLKSLRAKTRKNLRNARNRLEREHRISHDIVTTPDDLASIMRDAFEGRLIWMHEHAKTAPAFRDATFRQLIDDLPTSAFADQLIGFHLRTEDETISVQWGFVHQKRYYAYISARNPAFDGFSAGRIHLGMVLEACWERGIDIVELMAPASDYKLNWTKSLRQIDDFGLALTPGGYLYLEVWHRHGRTAAKRLYHTLPDSLRRQMSRVTNRNRAW